MTTIVGQQYSRIERGSVKASPIATISKAEKHKD